jgi:iron complex transport system permease protein
MKFLFLILLLVASVFLALSLGVEEVSLKTAIHDPGSLARMILLDIRLPRILLGALVGIALSVAGLAFQALLRNPLADPYILGVSGGAALGSVLALGLHLPFALVPLTSFASALASMVLIYFLAQVKGRLHPHTLLLVGVLFNTTTFSLILFINALVTMEDLHRIWFLMVGSLEAVEWTRLAWVAFLVFLGVGILFFDASALNLITLGEESAGLLGVDVERVRRRVFFGLPAIGATVSVAGLVGFVGLAVPHMIRFLFGSDYRRILPASALGVLFVVLADLIAGEFFGPALTQLPVGLSRALIGAPVFFIF